MTATRRIDAHHHLWDLSARPQEWLDELEVIRRDFGPEDLRAVAGPAGVDATVLVQVLNDVDETAEFLAVAGNSDLIEGVVGWVDLTAPDVAEQLDRLRSGPGGDRLVLSHGGRTLLDEPVAALHAAWMSLEPVLAG